MVKLYHGTYTFAFNPNSCWIETLPYTCHVLVIVPFMKCIRDTAQYCKERKAFGKNILDNQVVYYRLSELATEVEMLRSLLYRAARMYYIAIVSIMNSQLYLEIFYTPCYITHNGPSAVCLFKMPKHPESHMRLPHNTYSLY